jgi:hypothetical protein
MPLEKQSTSHTRNLNPPFLTTIEQKEKVTNKTKIIDTPAWNINATLKNVL